MKVLRMAMHKRKKVAPVHVALDSRELRWGTLPEESRAKQNQSAAAQVRLRRVKNAHLVQPQGRANVRVRARRQKHVRRAGDSKCCAGRLFFWLSQSLPGLWASLVKFMVAAAGIAELSFLLVPDFVPRVRPIAGFARRPAVSSSGQHFAGTIKFKVAPEEEEK